MYPFACNIVRFFFKQFGLGDACLFVADQRGFRAFQFFDDQTDATIDSTSESLTTEIDTLLVDERDADAETQYQFECDLRYQGTESSLAMSREPIATLVDRFHETHERTYGYAQRDRDVELVSVRCEGTLRRADSEIETAFSETTAKDHGSMPLWHAGGWVDAKLIDRDELSIGQTIDAPAIVVGKYSTLVIEPGWSGCVLEGRIVELVPQSDGNGPHLSDAQIQAADDPVMLEVVARRLQGIADAMGEISCALVAL